MDSTARLDAMEAAINMLNLQTVTEELGKECVGKAWVIVTSQQDIDSITKVKGNDFSKIQGRFDTRLSLSSANVDAVIKKRILEKTDAAAQSLRLLYEQKLQKQLKECRDYDEMIAHLALNRIELDLDDGVKVNYRKIQTAADGKFYEVLADSKSIMAKEK